MGIGFYPHLAWDSIRKNRRFYLPYILTCTGMVMMFYIIVFLAGDPLLKTIRGGSFMAEMLGMGTYVIMIFAVLFLFYTNSFLMKRRKKEFGLYNVLGMGKGNLARILFWESVQIAFISISTGLVFGMVFAKLGEIAVMHAEGAAAILYRKEMQKAENPTQARAQFVEDFKETYANPYEAAKYGYVDDVIEPDSTRPRLIAALLMLAGKRETLPAKKHGTMPL